MSATPRTPARRTRTWSITAMGLTLAIGAGCFVALRPTTSAATTPTLLAGRWAEEQPAACKGADCPAAYDFVPCGDRWCGIEVKGADRQCGRVAFRITLDEADIHRAVYTGRFERTGGIAPYTVRVILHAQTRRNDAPAGPMLTVFGNTGDNLELHRRTFPLHMAMRRQGEAACKAEANLT